VTETLTEQKMNIEEIEELKRGDLVRDRVTGAIFKVCQVDDYNGLFEPEDGVIIPLSLELVYKPDNIDAIYSGDHEDEKFEKVGDWDWIFLDMASFRNAAVNLDQADRYLTCEDLEPTTMERLLKPENITSFKSEGLIEFSEEAEEAALAENLIFPVEEARANKEKFFNLKRELVQISQLIKEASAQGKSCVRIPSDLDRLEITTQFSRAGYKIYAGCIAW
jgi:hypothetical protein